MGLVLHRVLSVHGLDLFLVRSQRRRKQLADDWFVALQAFNGNIFLGRSDVISFSFGPHITFCIKAVSITVLASGPVTQ